MYGLVLRTVEGLCSSHPRIPRARNGLSFTYSARKRRYRNVGGTSTITRG